MKPKKKEPDHVMTDQCPRCREDLTGSEIPIRARELYPGGSTHFTKVMSGQVRMFNRLLNRTETVMVFQCPLCGHQEKSLKGFAVRIRREPPVSELGFTARWTCAG